MKKIFEKQGILRCMGALMDIFALILFIVAAFVEETNPDMILKIVGMVLFIAGSMMIALKSEKHTLAKSILVLVLAGIIAAWLFTSGMFHGSDFVDKSFTRIGLTDIGFMLYYSVYFMMDKIPLLLVVYGFYGVLSHISGYQKLTDTLAEKFGKHPIATSVVISLILFVFTSLFSQTLIVLLFIPFFVTILSKMGMDKLTIFVVTFGSALVGILGCTYGTDSLTVFNEYFKQDAKFGINYRYMIAAVAIVLYNFFVVMRVRKIADSMKKNVKNATKENDTFEVEKASNKDKTKMLPAIIVLAISVIITVLGYINWNTIFGIEIFDKFHEWLTGLETGNEFYIIQYILGANSNALGSFKYVFNILIVLLIVSGLLAFLYKMSFDEYVESFYAGTKKMIKPLLFLIFANMLFAASYISGSPLNSMFNWILNLVEGFNPYLTTIVAFITSVFHSDFGYVAYTIGSFLTNVYADNIEIVHTIFTSMYGIVQIFVPTSAMLVLGLSMMKISYKDWLKYIWLYVIGMIIILLVLFTVVTYI